MGSKTIRVSGNLVSVYFTRYAILTLSLPALSLAYCFISAYLFRGDEVNDTDCNVTNSIPSASAVTGIKPQAYVWRICIGLHSAPRFLAGFMYFNLYSNSLPFIQQNLQGVYKFLTHLCFWLYTIECSCLLAVSCISNKENYPVHEKIFVGFMVTSIAHMTFGTILFRWSKYKPMTELERRSYFWKKFTFFCIIVSTIGLLWFFVQHRVYCVPGAFSYFSIFEYLIAYSNMGYHTTGHFDFYNRYLLAGFVEPMELTNETTCNNSGIELTNGTACNNTNVPISNGTKKNQ